MTKTTCHACGYEFNDEDQLEPSSIDSNVMLCNICMCTYSGTTVTQKNFVPTNFHVLESMAWIANHLLEQINKNKG